MGIWMAFGHGWSLGWVKTKHLELDVENGSIDGIENELSILGCSWSMLFVKLTSLHIMRILFLRDF